MCQHLEARLQSTGGLRFFERRDQIGERAVVHATAALGGGDRQADREMRFADARRTEEDDVFAALDEAELVEALHLLTSERWLKGKIKFGQPFDDRETARAHGGLQAPVVAQLDLGV